MRDKTVIQSGILIFNQNVTNVQWVFLFSMVASMMPKLYDAILLSESSYQSIFVIAIFSGDVANIYNYEPHKSGLPKEQLISAAANANLTLKSRCSGAGLQLFKEATAPP